MGAAAILTDAEGARLAREELAASDAALVVAEDPRQALAHAAALWFGAQPETMVAVTGTNGKTCVASFARQIWEELGFSAVNLGTTGVEGAWTAPLRHTTPEPITLHRVLAEAGAGRRDPCRDGGLVPRAGPAPAGRGAFWRRRVSPTSPRITWIITTRFEAYFAAKVGLFDRVLPEDGVAVINLDDPRGPRWRAIADGARAGGDRRRARRAGAAAADGAAVRRHRAGAAL